MFKGKLTKSMVAEEVPRNIPSRYDYELDFNARHIWEIFKNYYAPNVDVKSQGLLQEVQVGYAIMGLQIFSPYTAYLDHYYSLLDWKRPIKKN